MIGRVSKPNEGSIEILIKLAYEAHSPKQIAVVDFDAVLVREAAPKGRSIFASCARN
jgi:hypothetical protein